MQEKMKKGPALGLVSIDKPSIENVGPKPRATLVSWTPDMANVLHQVWKYAKEPTNTLHIQTKQCRMHDAINENDIPRIDPDDEEEFLRKFFKEWMPVSRMATLTFELENIPPALLQQLSRHKWIEMFVKSARVFYDNSWADAGGYFTPDSCSTGIAKVIYDAGMSNACESMNRLLEIGVALEDARGLLPMHSLYKMTLHMSVASLQGIVQKRTCNLLQQQLWAPLMRDWRDELCRKVSPAFEVLFAPPCRATGKCQAPTENEERIHGLVPIEPCPIYLKHFRKA